MNRRSTLYDPRSGHPTLQSVDYGIVRLLQDGVYREPIRDLEELKQRLVNTWADVKQSVVDKAVT